ncbi:MAG: class I mannose-6-phosphate isomerase [Bacteroidales bacterium]|nr:class I mannose-6-phosphate isomerase [Bacteroidales bacterium]
MNTLYPLKFSPIILDKMWGGSKLKDILHKPTVSDKAGESWEISGVDGNISIAENGFLAGNSLEELIEVYMGDLVGDHVFDKFGIRFPLLIKYIDANDVLSIQVHPDDKLARERHNSFGKTEMWYVMQADEHSELIVGFNRKVDKEIYLKHLNEMKLPAILNTEPVAKGDVFFLPAGRVHAIGSGILLAEIQQTSDITYRIYDFDRRDSDGNPRELHNDLAADAIDYNFYENYRSEYKQTLNRSELIQKCKYFTTSFICANSRIEKNVAELDSFIIYMCVEGNCAFEYNGKEQIDLKMGETILIPAMLNNFNLIPAGEVKLLEVFIDEGEQ